MLELVDHPVDPLEAIADRALQRVGTVAELARNDAQMVRLVSERRPELAELTPHRPYAIVIERLSAMLAAGCRTVAKSIVCRIGEPSTATGCVIAVYSTASE